MEIGIDIEEINRIQRAHKKWGERFLEKIYTKKEIEYCFIKQNPYPSLCGRFCAKEAVIKATSGSLSFKEIEIINDKNGKPAVFINGSKSDIKISLSHSKQYAAAVAITQ